MRYIWLINMLLAIAWAVLGCLFAFAPPTVMWPGTVPMLCALLALRCCVDLVKGKE